MHYNIKSNKIIFKFAIILQWYIYWSVKVDTILQDLLLIFTFNVKLYICLIL